MVKFIGYDAGEGYRSDKVLLGDLADRKYSKWYPLMEWGWDRAACQRAIDDAGLPQPGKSDVYKRQDQQSLFRPGAAIPTGTGGEADCEKRQKDRQSVSSPVPSASRSRR